MEEFLRSKLDTGRKTDGYGSPAGDGRNKRTIGSPMVTCVVYLSCRSRLGDFATGRMKGGPETKETKEAKRPRRPRRTINEQGQQRYQMTTKSGLLWESNVVKKSADDEGLGVNTGNTGKNCRPLVPCGG